MRTRLLAALVPAAAVLLASACSSASGASGTGSASSAAIVAVGAENEYADVISQVGGRYVKAAAIMSNPATDPHTFEASAQVAREVSAARLVVQNGLGYDTFMKTIENAAPDPQRKVIVVQNLLGLPDSTAEPAPVVPAGHDDGGRERRGGGPFRPPAGPRGLLQGERGGLRQLAHRLDQRHGRVQGEISRHPRRHHRTRRRLHAPGGRRGQPDPDRVPARHHERHRPVGAGRRRGAEPAHRAQGQGPSSTTSR